MLAPDLFASYARSQSPPLRRFVPIKGPINFIPAPTPYVQVKLSAVPGNVSEEVSPLWSKGTNESNVALIIGPFFLRRFHWVVNLRVISIWDIKRQWGSCCMEFCHVVRFCG